MEDFEDWYERERPRVWATCAALCGDVDAAADATDEAFVRALERWRRVATMARPGGWVQVVALNHLRRSLRRRRREHPLAAADVVTGIGLRLPDLDLWAAVAALPARQRTAIVLRYVHDLTEADMAEVMGVTRGTVAACLSQAQRRLRRAIQAPSGDDGATDKERLP